MDRKLINPDKTKVLYTGKTLAKNTIFNLLGYGIPILFAIVLIPFLLKGLGIEKFGILNLIWMVIGYFSFFDFGIGKALTKIIAEKIGTNKIDEIPAIFWTSFVIMVIISSLGTLLILLFSPVLVHKYLNLSLGIQTETLNAFFILAFSIPIVTTTAGIRGVLEAYQKFGVINIIRIILGVSSFLAPLICLFFSNNLVWIVIFLILVRLIIWLLYLSQCFKINEGIRGNFLFNKNLIKPIIKLSSWMTISNVVGPSIIYLDRLLIGVMVSAAAISYYATPYEVVTKLLLIPGALTGVLFPAFSANYLSNPDYTKKLSLKSVKYIFLLLFPIVILVVNFASEGLSIWLGSDFAENSHLVLQFLAFGVLFNSLAYIPFTLLEGIGRPDITAKVLLAELPVYIIGMWFAIKQEGIYGAAAVWFIRMIIDAFLLFWMSNKILLVKIKIDFKIKYFFFLIGCFCGFVPSFFDNLLIKSVLAFFVLVLFFIITWKYFLLNDERIFIVSQIKNK